MPVLKHVDVLGSTTVPVEFVQNVVHWRLLLVGTMSSVKYNVRPPETDANNRLAQQLRNVKILTVWLKLPHYLLVMGCER